MEEKFHGGRPGEAGTKSAGAALWQAGAALKAVRGSEVEFDAFFRALADSIPHAVWIAGSAGELLFTNRLYRDYTGLSERDLLAGRWVEVPHPDDLPPALEAWQRAIASGTATQVVYRLRRKDGVYRWHLTVATPYRDESGGAVRWFGTCTDIHELKVAEERATRLQAFTAALTRTTCGAEVFQALLHEGVAALGADAAAVFGLDEEAQVLRMIHHRGYTDDELRGWGKLSLDSQLPSAIAVRDGQPLFVSSLASFYRDADPREPRSPGGDFASYAALPLRARGKTMGAVTFAFRASQHFDDATRIFLQTVADLAGQGCERLELQEEAVRLRQLEYEKLYSFLMQAPFPIAVVRGPDLVYEFSNPANQVYLGGRDVVGKPVKEAFPEVDESVLARIHEVMATGRRITMKELPHYFPTGGVPKLHYVNVEYQPIRNAQGEVERVMVIGVDITEMVMARQILERNESERRRMERVLRESEAHFRALASAMPQLVWTALPDGTVDYYNDRMAEYVAIEKSSGGTWSWEPLVHPDDVELTHDRWSRARDTGTEYSCEHRVRMADGSYRWHLSRGVPVRDAAGAVARWYGTATDIQSLKETQLALAEAVRARDEFLSIASHELKTPLTSLKLQGQMKRRALNRGRMDEFAPEKLLAFFDRYDVQLDRLNRLVDDMLDVARINEGRLELKTEIVDFSALVSDVTARHRDYLESAGCELTAAIPPALEVRADRLRLEQVVVNLLTNAAKYGAGKPVRVELYAEPGRVCLSVADRGIGIAPENLARIFERFERAVPGNQISGLGLGLYITRKILDLHGGGIAVESELGRGSTFTVTLPAA